MSRRFGQRVDQAVDQRSFRRRQFRVLAPAGINRERSPPSSRDTSSAYRPAALITCRAAIVSLSVRTRMAPAVCSAPTIGVPGRKMAPDARADCSSARISPSASTMPVAGENSAATAAIAGSRLAMKARSTISSPSTPLARPLAQNGLELRQRLDRVPRRSACRTARARRRDRDRTHTATAALRRTTVPSACPGGWYSPA